MLLKVCMLRSGMGLAGPHLAAYAQSLNSKFTMLALHRPTRSANPLRSHL